MMKVCIALLSGLALLASTFAHGNLRAPMHDVYMPSSALSKPAEGLEVQREILKIDCDHDQCQVDATYLIHASSDKQLVFEFMLPTSGEVQALINGTSMPTQSEPAPSEQKAEEDKRYLSRFLMHPIPPPSKAVFRGRLNAGNNRVDVRYVQPLSIFEAQYGYFKHSRFVEEFVYLLGPLKSWKMAEDFSLDLQVSTLRKRATRDPRKLFKRRAISCNLPGGEMIREKGQIIYRNMLGHEFPDRLECSMGASDLLSTYD